MQGDIVDRCPLIYWNVTQSTQGILRSSAASEERVIVLTQACDLASQKTTRVQIAVVHEAQRLVQQGILKPQAIRDQVRKHRVFGWYFLPAGDAIPESIVDLREIHTLPRTLLNVLVGDGHRIASPATPYREHLAQHFAVTFSRIALPDEFPTE